MGILDKAFKVVEKAVGAVGDVVGAVGTIAKSAGEAVEGFVSEKAKKDVGTRIGEVKSNREIRMVNQKCISCSAPLVGKSGQLVCCKYCDTNQTI